MTDQLLKLFVGLTEHRRLLRNAWSEETIHPDYRFTPGDPTGQCGPTALWVSEMLRSRGYSALLCWGSVAVGERDNCVIAEHYWTQVDDYVIDLTGSQAEEIGCEVICSTHRELSNLSIFYTTKYAEPPVRMTAPGLRKRHNILVRNLLGGHAANASDRTRPVG